MKVERDSSFKSFLEKQSQLSSSLNVLLLGLLGESRRVVGNSSDSLRTVDPDTLSVLDDTNGRRMLELFSVNIDDIVHESGVLLVSGVNLCVVEVRELVEDLILEGLSVLVVLSLEVRRSSCRVVEEDDVDSVGTTVLVETTFEDVEEGLSVVVGKSVNSSHVKSEGEHDAEHESGLHFKYIYNYNYILTVLNLDSRSGISSSSSSSP